MSATPPGRASPADAPRGDSARVTVDVAVPPAVAFEAFTHEIDRWWRRGPRFRHAGAHAGIVHVEPRVGGRVFESIDVDGVTQVIEIGRVRDWSPPERLAFSWRNANFGPGEWTQVEVTFAASRAGTRVTVVHRGWAALPPDHPARHGRDAVATARAVGLFWGDLLTSLREFAAQRR